MTLQAQAGTLLRRHILTQRQSSVPPNSDPALAVYSCVNLDKSLNLSGRPICHL